MENKFMTIKEVMETLRVSQLTVYRYIKAGKLPAYKVGRDYRIKETDFKKFLESKKIK